MKKNNLLLVLFLGMYACAIAQTKTFTNPLLPSGADPYSFYKDGYYYYTHTAGSRLVIWKTKNLAELKTAESKTIFIPPAGTAYSKDLWAPEIHFIQGKWYTYFAADDGSNNTHRMYVVENASADPMQGDWILKGKVADSLDKWAIDGDVFEHKGQLYMIWSGWEGDINFEQDIYIAKMKNPWTIEGNRVRISRPAYNWEKNGDLKGNPSHVDVNEGPQILKHKNKLFIIYSASGCWTDFYALGMLTFTGKNNLLDSMQWKKSPAPVFVRSPENKVYAPGHNSFFKSPDGKEDWILYHANAEPGQGCGRNRSPRAQKFTWKRDGTPNFGEPIKTNVAIPIPSEEQPTRRATRLKNKRKVKHHEGLLFLPKTFPALNP
jgi:GH43 family beta-xylosidase